MPAAVRGPLARAIAWDTIVAVRASPAVDRVVVVTSDEPLLRDLPPGCEPVADPGAGLNAAVRAGLATAAPTAPRAALLGDLPALRPDDLSVVLAAALACEAGALADADRTGTALLTRTAPGLLEPAFGEKSFARHLARGFTDLGALVADPEATIPTVRRDVDTLEHLRAAAALGLGSRTSAVLASVGVGVGGGAGVDGQAAQGARSPVA